MHLDPDHKLRQEVLSQKKSKLSKHPTEEYSNFSDLLAKPAVNKTVRPKLIAAFQIWIIVTLYSCGAVGLHRAKK